jgi:hypothetical protein
MTYSAIVTGKDQKKVVRVSFERPKEKNVSDTAEGILPDCRITKCSGFSDEEVSQLEQYLKANLDDIMSKAKVISNPLKWL